MPVGFVRMSCERSMPPSPAGSPHGFTGVGLPDDPPSWPLSGSSKLAPSPPVTHRLPSLSNASAPPAWLGNCWHQSWRSVSALSSSALFVEVFTV